MPTIETHALVSIIIPVFNVELCLRECINSVICQTCADFEIILIDDGSTDRSGTNCDEYAEIDDRIIVIHEQNDGPSVARNRGFDANHGEYVYFLDSHDSIAADAIECLIETMKRGHV